MLDQTTIGAQPRKNVYWTGQFNLFHTEILGAHITVLLKEGKDPTQMREL